MALSKPSLVPVLTKDETNFLRLAHLVIRISPSAVRTLFDKHFNPAGLQSSLNQIKVKIESLYQKRVINKSQLDMLFPANGPCVTSIDMDVTLMLVLIRNFTTVRIQDTLPPSTNVSEGDDLSRIKHYRNLIAHSADGKINDAEFQSAWTEISKALQRIGGVSIKGECDTLLTAELDNSYRDIYLHFIRTEKQLQKLEDDFKQLQLQLNDPVPYNIREHMLDEIKTWQTDEGKFFVTSAVKPILSLIQKNSFVVITGSPGMGKSATARHIALTLKTSDDFDILPILDPNDIVKYCKNGCNQIFILDDICGKFIVDKHTLRNWERNLDTLQKLFRRNPNSLRVLATCRFQISKDEQFQRLSECLEIFECNLLSENLKLSTDEKREIAKNHFDNEIVQKLDNETVNRFDMFPLLCSLFARLDKETNFDIFNNPGKQLERELNELRYKNEGGFVGLVLLVFNNNALNKNIFKDQTNQTLDKIFDHLFKICKLKKRPVQHHVMAMLQTLNETYVTESDSQFKAVHDKIFDMISFFLGKIMIEVILEYGNSIFVTTRIRLESLNQPHVENTIMIPAHIEDLYFRRIMQEIEHRKMFNVFFNPQMQDKIYQTRLINHLSEHSSLLKVFVHNQWAIVFSETLSCKLIFDYLINELEAETKTSDITEFEECINVNDFIDYDADYVYFQTKNAPIFFASALGLLKSTSTLLKHGVDINSVFTIGESKQSLLTDACYKGRADIVSLLIKYKCDVNSLCTNMPPLHIACKYQHLNIVDILVNANCDVNIRDKNQRTPLFIACQDRNQDIVKKLLNSDCDVNIANLYNETPLHVSCQKGYEEIVILLLSKHCDLDKSDKDGNTAYEVCCKNGHLNIAKLIEENALSRGLKCRRLK